VRGGRAIIAPAAIFVGLIMITPRVLVFSAMAVAATASVSVFADGKVKLHRRTDGRNGEQYRSRQLPGNGEGRAAAITASEKAGEIYRKRAAGGGPLARVR